MEEGGWTARRPWRRGRGVGPAPGMARSGRRPRRRGTALVCGWRWDPALVFLVARLCPGCFLVPGRRPCPCPAAPAACACRPLPTAAGPPPRPVCATACVPFRHPCSPRSGTELASPHVGVVSRPLSAGGVPGWSSALGALRGGRGGGALVHSRVARARAVGAAGTRRESVLPGRLRLQVVGGGGREAP